MLDNAMNKRQPIIKMIWIGLLLLSICLILCIVQISILKTTYSKEIKEEYNSHHRSAVNYVNNFMGEMIDITRDRAMSIANTDFSENAIMGIIDNTPFGKIYSQYFYIDVNGNILYNHDAIDSESASSYADLVKNNLVPGTEKMAFYRNVYDDYIMLLAEPVTTEKENAGFFCTVINLEKFFGQEAFSYQNSLGNFYIVGIDMSIKYSMMNSLIELQDGQDFYSALVNYSDGSDEAKKDIGLIKNDMLKAGEGYSSFVTANGDEMLVSYMKLSAVNSIYLVSCFNDNLVENQIQPLIFRSVLSCMAIVFLMIIIIFYVWVSVKKANNTIEKLAYDDPVTKGKNINYFKEFAHSVMSVFKETPFVIYRFDIMNFRYINEAYGHIRADGILQSCITEFAEIFSDKELCVRMNADQFLAIIVNDKEVDLKIKKYTDKINEEARSKGIKYPIKFKRGIYQIKKHDSDIDVMIDHANAARKMVAPGDKQLQMIYTDEIVNKMRKIDRIENDMKRALATGEFKVFYQAKWDIVGNHLAGAEALVRWIKPDGSMVFPDEFIPIFEKNGFIEKLDFFVLENVCEEFQKLLNEGKDVYPISVNQSRVLLHSPDYVENVEKIIKKYEIPEGAIELEITESVFDDDRERMKETINRLKKCGVKVAVDDFGSGYSSLNMLKDEAFDIIKIDREFFSESATSNISMWILQKIIEMVNGLGMEIICEGVETQDQVNILKMLGCRMVQGYFYSKPISYDEYKEKYYNK